MAAAVAMVAGCVVATATGAAAAPDAPLCAWRFMTNGDVLNVAFPDTNATYWIMPFALGPGDSIELAGEFPAARYMSLNTYGTDLGTVDTLRDDQIMPSSGSGNPFADASAAGLPPDQRRWQATVVNRPADHSRNEISALPAGQALPIGFLIIRVYVPDDPNSVTGGVSLPSATLKLGGASVPSQPCDTVFDPSTMSGPGPALAKAAVDQFIGAAAAKAFRPGTPEATFVNPGDTAGLFPNGDNKYIGAGLSYQPGRIVVVRGRAPSFPDTRTGASPTAPTDTRYWSMCQNDQVSPYPVVACAADFQTQIDDSGYFTYVVAAPTDIPANLGTATLLPWGRTDVEKTLFMRNMLPSPGYYPNSVQASQDSGVDPSISMGDYYPRATYCDKTTFETGGAAACFG